MGLYSIGHQPTNKPTNQPTDQPTYQPTNNQPTNRPTNNQPTNRPTNQPTNSQPTDQQPTNQPTDQPTNQTTNKQTTNKSCLEKYVKSPYFMQISNTFQIFRLPAGMFVGVAFFSCPSLLGEYDWHNFHMNQSAIILFESLMHFAFQSACDVPLNGNKLRGLSKFKQWFAFKDDKPENFVVNPRCNFFVCTWMKTSMHIPLSVSIYIFR